MSACVPNAEVKSRLSALYDELMTHDGFAEMRVEIRLLKRGQKDIILHGGGTYRLREGSVGSYIFSSSGNIWQANIATPP